MNPIKIIYRLMLFFLAISAYLLSGLLLVVHHPRVDEIFFKAICFSLKLLFKSLGITVLLPQKKITPREDSSGYSLYIANHDSLMDGLFLMTYFGLRTIAEAGIKNFLPFLGYYTQRLHHVLVDEGDPKSHAVALYQALNKMGSYHEFAVFPSAGIRRIDKNFAQGAYYLAKKLNAEVVPLFFFYKPAGAFSTVPFQTDKQFFLRCILYGGRTMRCEMGSPIPIEQFQNEGEFKAFIQSLYYERVYRHSSMLPESWSDVLLENSEP